WGETGVLQVRMGVHAGEAEVRDGDYFGPTVIRAARIMAVAHGGQVLLSATAAALVIDQLPDGATVRDLGEHRLKDLGRPERVFQLVERDLVSDFPPLPTLNRRPNNLPTQASAFVGRGAELDEIGKRLADDEARLLTLTGPGGTGKTRLALHAAADQIERFDDGVFFVDLSAIRDTESVLAAIARAASLNETGDEPLREGIARQLQERRLLLVLDNFEQVTVASTALVELLHDCPGLKLLVTSREALRVRGEHVFSVPPLSLPQASRGHSSAEQLGRYEAVQLFVERARAVRSDFDLTDENAEAVSQICLRLDGLPLAIELATARINLFSPDALRDRLGSRLGLLRGGARDLPARQQTLRATIEWSYQLLEPWEQRLFELLSVFSSTGLEAVDVVMGSVNGLSQEKVDTIDGLTSLLAKSLIKQVNPGVGEPRVQMLETIKEYAGERLAGLPELCIAAQRAHATYFADFAEQQWDRLTGAQRESALAEMVDDIENLRIAWRYWVVERDLDQLNKLVDSMWLLYDARGWYKATIELTTDLLDVLASSPSTPERATQEVTLRTSLARALMAIKGYTSEVEEAYERALELFEGTQELPQLFPVLRGLANFYIYRAEFEKGAQVGRAILRLAEQQDDPGMRIDGHFLLGANLALLSELQPGLDHLDKAISYSETESHRSRKFRLGNDPRVACLTTSAFLLWMLGFPDRGLDRANQAVALATRLEHPFTLAYALFHAGFLHLWRREPECVRDRGEGVLAVAEEHDLQIWRAVGMCLLGAGETGMGRFEDGLAHIRDGFDLYHGLKTPPVFWPLLLSIEARALAGSGRPRDGLARIDEAIEIASHASGTTLLPEFYLLRGDVLLALSDGITERAEPWFKHALDVARDVGARMPELRAAVRLCRLWRDQGNVEDGGRLLHAVYDSFTEGFATADLVEARGVLETVS
ncbi:MAG: adenylate/guanylate cyclase domain-containing protein, partial [Actinomycetota bacterium]|nr:adenylate/guanylate cyclase domain-containing protein [Actinomycetota bacterium]